ncbi:hypothetical protein Lalb_Chr09g0330671 [Lupinus albus]|uniref:Uncharacterized protein n=1 Tax=Lupinus albus TaxID=3870 RepID=A0A6A4Q0L9_LUPAL|nr:hypothetical protein Lalb_Chr09g0330671 [Lupinus albus]
MWHYYFFNGIDFNFFSIKFYFLFFKLSWASHSNTREDPNPFTCCYLTSFFLYFLDTTTQITKRSSYSENQTIRDGLISMATDRT